MVWWQETEEEAADVKRLFTRLMKQECWRRAPPVPGRDPDRWRFDAAGNIVSFTLRGCLGCLCHEYDHIVPFSLGGSTTIDNCQILQTRVNRMKGNDVDDLTRQRLYGCAHKWTTEELDAIEMAIYGDVNRDGRRCRCRSIGEFEEASGVRIPKKQQGIPGCETDYEVMGGAMR